MLTDKEAERAGQLKKAEADVGELTRKLTLAEDAVASARETDVQLRGDIDEGERVIGELRTQVATLSKDNAGMVDDVMVMKTELEQLRPRAEEADQRILDAERRCDEAVDREAERRRSAVERAEKMSKELKRLLKIERYNERVEKLKQLVAGMRKERGKAVADAAENGRLLGEARIKLNHEAADEKVLANLRARSANADRVIEAAKKREGELQARIKELGERLYQYEKSARAG